MAHARCLLAAAAVAAAPSRLATRLAGGGGGCRPARPAARRGRPWSSSCCRLGSAPPPNGGAPPVLPTPFDDGRRPYQVTTPIYYVNDRPHVGHAYTSVACDVLARYQRLAGREVLFCTGTDEHGQKVEEAARRRGISPQELVDEVSGQFRELAEGLEVEPDRFVRTTDQGHQRAVRHLWRRLEDSGAIYLGSYEGWYSIRDECYYAESELVDGRAPTGSEVEWTAKEPSYFFRLSDYEGRLLRYYEDHPDLIAPESRRNEVLAFVRGGLRDLSVSRTSFRWGVPVPGDDGHIVYVWIDALANYLSALGYPGTEGGAPSGDDAILDRFWPTALHVVGKDILRFHAVYWPALLMAADLPLPRRIFAHGWWTINGEKMSKSEGNVVDPLRLVDKYGVDPTRFYLMADVVFGSDGDFSRERMVLKVNANLANEVGNLCQRTLTMVVKNFDGAVPVTIGQYTQDDRAMLESASLLRGKCDEAISTQKIHRYVEHLVAVVWETNQYIDRMEPWVLRKTDPERMATVLFVIMEILRAVAILYQPLIPGSASKILDQLGVPASDRSFAHLKSGSIQPGTSLAKPVIIFPRFDLP